MSGPWIAPDACTLPSVERPVRVGEFDALLASYVVGVHQLSPTSVRLILNGPEGLADQVQDLADRESACCSFFTFTLDTSSGDEGGPDTVQLDIEVPPERSDVLAALTDQAQTHQTEARPTAMSSSPSARRRDRRSTCAGSVGA